MTVPTILSDIVRTILIMSISGGAIVLLLLALRPLVRHRLPKSAQYYFWLVVLVTLLVPVSQLITLPSRVTDIAPVQISNIVERNVVSVTEEPPRLIFQPPQQMPPVTFDPDTRNLATGNVNRVPALSSARAVTHLPPSRTAQASTIFMLLYPLIAFLVLAYNLGGYAYFAKKLRSGYIKPYAEEAEMLAHLTQKGRKPRLYISDYAATPMLIGLFRPVIVLPNRDYTDAQLQSIILHELTHMRRWDIAVKWASLLACAVHWFNPLVWVARREIDRNCELSCDEAVIRNMDISAKQNYGNTLIDVATDTKIPLPVLSTTMCEEKRALKERLGAIMKSKKYTRLAVLATMLILLVAVLGACGLGASRNGENGDDDENGQDPTIAATTPATTAPTATQPNATEPPTPPVVNPVTHQDFADNHVAVIGQQLVSSTFGSAEHVRLMETRINQFERVAVIDDLTPHPIELWRLDAAFRVEYAPFVRWGTFTPDQNGWISNATAFHPARTLLAFYEENGQLRFMGDIPFGWDQHNDHPEVLHMALRDYLISLGELPMVDFPGNHAFVYIVSSFDGNLETGHVMRLLMSQPVWQGEGGIWVVDSVYHLHVVPSNPVRHRWGELMSTVMEEYVELQRRQDFGEPGSFPCHGSPYAAAQFYMEGNVFSPYASILGVYEVPAGTIDPHAIPRRHGPELIVDPNNAAFQMTTNPRTFSHRWPLEGHEYHLFREPKLQEFNLAFDEAIHFQLDDGRFAVITGWRPMISREEFVRYTGWDVPQQVGDFTLVGVNVNDNITDSIIVYNHPLSKHAWLGFEYDPSEILPIDQPFSVQLPVSSFYAVYVNSAGQHVALNVFNPLLHFSEDFPTEERFAPLPISIHDIPPHGQVILVGADDTYILAYHSNGNIQGENVRGMELAFIHLGQTMSPWSAWSYMQSFPGMIPATEAELLELLELFNPVQLYEQFNWFTVR